MKNKNVLIFYCCNSAYCSFCEHLRRSSIMFVPYVLVMLFVHNVVAVLNFLYVLIVHNVNKIRYLFCVVSILRYLCMIITGKRKIYEYSQS